ncbi:MAG: TatD family hydrolase [Bacilli bacterium]
MELIDTHAHILKSENYNIEEVILKAKMSNVNKIINASVDLNTSIENISLSKQYNGIIFACVGIYPEYASTINSEDLIKIEELIKKNKVIAIGEIGLDYHYNKADKLEQKELFEYLLSLAQKYNLPVVIHSRDATDDTINILKKYKLKGIIHCFSGSKETAEEYHKLGYLLGIGGVITFKNSKLKEVIKEIDTSYIVLETDSPYMTPVPYRGQKNEPKNISVVAEFISEIKNISIEEIALITTNNAHKIFDFNH